MTINQILLNRCSFLKFTTSPDSFQAHKSLLRSQGAPKKINPTIYDLPQNPNNPIKPEDREQIFLKNCAL